MMLDSLGIPHTGTFTDEVAKLNDHPLLVQKNGFRLALLNYTYGTNGLPVTKPNLVNTIDTAAIRADLHTARQLSPDITVVFMHWGSEYQSLPSKWQKDVAAFCFKHGAQLVIGAHPHVLQPMEWHKEKNQLVAYSLGNFVSGQRKRYTDGGAMITIELEKITLSNGPATTRIDTANYVLEWVYRTADHQKNYYVLPVNRFEKDTTAFIKDETSRQAFKLFADDSRALYQKHNIAITESQAIPPDTLVTYKVLFETVKTDTTRQAWSVYPPMPFGMESVRENNGGMLLYSGEFRQQAIAEKYRQELAGRSYLKNVTVVKFVNGVRQQ
jgi:poly-gamma-glutamate synthesis protein (capsule biosynthesis protein)